MQKYPVLNIETFHEPVGEDEFYANLFSLHLNNHHATITVPHKHDFYLVVLFTHGYGKHEVDFTTYDIKPGSLFCMQPGQMHHWEFSSPPEGYLFFHSREFYEIPEPGIPLHDFPMYTFQQSPSLLIIEHDDDLQKITDFFKSIHEEYGGTLPYKRHRLRNLIEQVYIELARIVFRNYPMETAGKRQPLSRLQQLEKLIEEHHTQHKTASDYADMLHISAKHLNKLVQNALGKTTTDLIHDRLLLEAKRLLVRKEIPVQEIAMELGFEDTAYFSRLFRKKTGLSPREFTDKY
jgi:AraC-like DNA-binding protein